MKTIKMISAGGTLTLGLALAACSGAVYHASADKTPAPGAYSGNPSGSTAGDCLLGANGSDIEVGIANPSGTCARWIQTLAGAGLTWQPIESMIAPGQPGSADSDPMSEVCDLTDSSAEELYVEDGGSAYEGNRICSQEEQNGWTPESAPGPLASQLEQQGQQNEQASASASAAAAQASQQAADQQKLTADVNQLGSDSSSLNGDSSLAHDVNSMKTDLGSEENDYKTEQSDGCPTAGGDADTVGGDSDTVGGDLDSLNGDVQSLQSSGIEAVQGDISSVNADLSALKGDGISPAANAAPALSAGNQALKNASAAIDWAQSQAKQIDDAAQALSNTAQAWASNHGC